MSHPGVLRRRREEPADILWIGCNVQGIWHFCHRALAALLTALLSFSLLVKVQEKRVK